MDTISVMLRGSLHSEMDELAKKMTKQYPGNSLVLGKNLKALPEWAAFLNATSGSFLELDEGHRPTGHPGIHVIPNALSFSSHLKKSGSEFILSVIVGYELQQRISRASRLRWNTHPHGNMGTPAAATVIAKLMQDSPDEITQLINIATSLPLASSWGPCFEGATVRNTYAGISAVLGSLSYQLKQAHFTGMDNALEDIYQTILGESFDLGTFTRDIGQSYAIESNYFKFHACCAINHPILDAVMMLTKENIDLEKIEGIFVEVNKSGTRIAHLPPKDRQLSYKFSIPFAIASVLYHKDSKIEPFLSNVNHNQLIQKVAKKVSVFENPEFTAVWPRDAKARVTILTLEGNFSAECSNPKGSYENPASRNEIYQKSTYLIEPFIDDRSKYFSLFERIDQYEDMEKWTHELQELIEYKN
jgi:2-methylcitrate dehydratase PrpD